MIYRENRWSPTTSAIIEVDDVFSQFGGQRYVWVVHVLDNDQPANVIYNRSGSELSLKKAIRKARRRVRWNGFGHA